jgi:hypothetical protein
MKTIGFCMLALIVGTALGWFVSQRYARHKLDKVVEEMVAGSESEEAASAARALGVIGHIESGDTSNALQSLSRPIAHYYVLYSESGEVRNRRSNLFAAIENLTNNNPAVSEAVREKMERVRD